MTLWKSTTYFIIGFLVIMMVNVFWQKHQQERDLILEVKEKIEGQQNILATELFLTLEQAVSFRLENIGRYFSEKYPKNDLCLRLVNNEDHVMGYCPAEESISRIDQVDDKSDIVISIDANPIGRVSYEVTAPLDLFTTTNKWLLIALLVTLLINLCVQHLLPNYLLVDRESV